MYFDRDEVFPPEQKNPLKPANDAAREIVGGTTRPYRF
jgi:hypothetical protein